MQISYGELAQEGLNHLLGTSDALADTIYSLYCHQPSRSAARGANVVVLTSSRHQGDQLQGRDRREIEEDEAHELLWRTLIRDGCRIGAVVYDGVPEPGDYVLMREGEHYRLLLPATQPDPALESGEPAPAI